MEALAIALFGGFAVTVQDAPIATFESNKVRALLAYLTVEAGTAGARPHQRSTLAALLWPDYPEEMARTNLRHVLRQLRQTLPETTGAPPLLLTTQQTIQINPACPYRLDVARFTHLLTAARRCTHSDLAACPTCLARYQEAAELYRGDFLAGFSLYASEPFEAWLVVQREGWHRQALELFFTLAAYHEAQGDYEQAQHHARRQLALEPWREEAHRQLMRVLAASGQRSAALAQFAQCRKMLADELGVEPDAETVALYEQIRDGKLDKMTRRQGDKATELAEVTLSPRSAELTSKPHLVIPSPPHPVPPAPFVARDRELIRLDEYLAQAQAGCGQLVFVTGEAGSGKTALLQAFVRRAQAAYADLIVAGGICDAQTGISDPYLPFRTLLNLLTGAVDVGWPGGPLTQETATRLWHFIPVAVPSLVEWAPDLVEQLVPSAALLARINTFAPAGASWVAEVQEGVVRLRQRAEGAILPQARIFAQVSDLLHNLATQRPLLLILDDLHWADASSVSLLFHLSRTLEQRRIMIVGTYRPEDVAQGWEGKPHPLQSSLSEYKRAFGDIWIDLTQIPSSEGRRFVDTLLDSEPNALDEAFRQALFQHTEGHALFTVELLRDLQARGVLQRDAAGCWTVSRALDWATLPARVEGVIEKRIERLTLPLRQALATASVEGEEFTAEVVAQVQTIPEREFIRQLAQEVDRQHRLANAQGVIRVGARSLARYRFRHNLFRTYLYHSLDAAERIYLHEAVATTLESFYGEQTEQVAAQLAHHFAVAEIVDKAVDYLLQAGEKARLLSANIEAIAHFRQGLALLATLPDTPARTQRELVLQVPLGHTLSAIKGTAAPEVGEVFSRARTLCQQLGDSAQLFSVLHGLHRFYYGRGDWQAAREIGEQMVNVAQNCLDPTLLTEAQRALGVLLFHVGEFTLASTHAEQGIRFYDRQLHSTYVRLYGQDPGVLCFVFAAFNLWMLGYPDQARGRIEQMLALAEEIAHSYSLTIGLVLALVFYQFERQLQIVLARIETAITLASKQEFAYYLGLAMVMHGWALTEQRESRAPGAPAIERGIEQIRQGATLMRSTGAELARHYNLTLLAEALGKIGQSAEGLRVLDEALAAIPRSGHFWEAELYRIKGELLLMENVTEQANEAESCFHHAIQIAQQQNAKMLELRAVISLCRLWQRQGKIDQARQQLAAIYRWFSEGFDTPDLRAARELLEALDDPGHAVMDHRHTVSSPPSA